MDATPTALPSSPALRAAIRAAPDDDLPRLVYADWLDENGRPEWAGLIREQVADGRPVRFKPGKAADVRYAPLAWGADGDRRELPPVTVRFAPPTPRVAFTVARGFLSEVACPLAVWQAGGPAWVRRHPLARVALTDKRPTSHSHVWAFTAVLTPFTSHQLPPALLPFFPVAGSKPDPWTTVGVGLKFPRRKIAVAALSEALLAWARRPDELLLPPADPADPDSDDIFLL